MRASVGIALLVAACGDNTAPVELGVETASESTVAMIAYREGVGPWRTPSRVTSRKSETLYALDVASEYEAQVVCVDAMQLAVIAVYGMRDDPTRAVGCFIDSGNTPTFAVTGTMLQPGAVEMGSIDLTGSISSTAPWQFNLNVPHGIHDLIAVPGAMSSVRAVVIRRGQDVEAPLAEAPIDLAMEGMPLATIPVTVSGGGDDSVLSFVDLSTANGGATLSAGSHVEVVPSVSLLPDDAQYLEVYADGGAAPPALGRTIYARVDERSHLDVTLMPRLDGVTIASTLAPDLTATWSAPPTDDYDWLSINFGTSGRHHGIFASHAWLDAHTAALTLHTSAPGFDPSWIPSALPSSYCFWLDRNRSGISYSTSLCL